MPRDPSIVSTNVGSNSTNGETQDTFVEEMAERVRIRAKARGFNATTLGAAVQVPTSSAANYWAGKRSWPLESIPLLADRLGTNVEALLLGGDDRVQDRQLDYHAAPAGKSDDLVRVAEIDTRFGLGAAFMDEPAVPEMRSFSRAWLRHFTDSPPEELYWAKGRGNSMAPTIEDGEVVLIDRRQQSPRDSDLVWAFAWGDVGAIKRLRPMPDGTVKILSDNANVPPDIATEGEIHIFGRVVAVVKRV